MPSTFPPPHALCPSCKLPKRLACHPKRPQRGPASPRGLHSGSKLGSASDFPRGWVILGFFSSHCLKPISRVDLSNGWKVHWAGSQPASPTLLSACGSSCV